MIAYLVSDHLEFYEGGQVVDSFYDGEDPEFDIFFSIVEENPDISTKEAYELARERTKNINKEFFTIL